MPKPDPAHKETDKILRDMEKRLDEVYKQAYKEARQTADDFMKQFREMDKKKRQQVKDGELDKAEYERWRRTQVFQGNRYHQMADTLAADMTHTNQIAASVINGYLPEVYAVNHNYGTYEIEKGSRINTQYTMYDRQTVERLIRDNPDLLPRKAAVNVPKDQLWNKKHINSAITQGILQGEAIDKIAQRLAATVTDMSHTSAIRNARTMTTSAQNGGRIDSYKRAEGMGIKMLQVWMATLDGRTRHEHRQLDGQKRKVGEAFEVDGEKIFFPGDPSADPALVYNCFVGDTKVASDSKLIRSYKQEYDGKLVEVKTANGVNFTCTPNHPILTPFGWIGADRLNKGDNILVTVLRDRSALSRYSNIDHVHPCMETLHDAFKRSGAVSRNSPSAVNFHGDIPTSDIEIVTKKRLLRFNRNACFYKLVDKFLLKYADESLVRKCTFMKHFGSVMRTSFSNISRKCKSFPFFWRSLSHSNIHGFRTISRSDAVLTEYSIDNLAAESVIDGELLDRLSGKVFLDKIIDINVCVLKTHVYNLQTKNGYYFANSIIPQNSQKCNGIFAIAKNCRCTLVGEVEGIDYNLSDVSQRDNKLGDMTYEEWKEEKRKQDNAEPPAPKPEPKPEPPKAEDKPVEVEVPAPTVENPDAVDEPIKPKLNIFDEMEQNRKEIDKALHDVEEMRRSLDYEVGTIIDRKGNIVEVINGSEHSVAVDDGALKDLIFTHNHPSGGCFSDNDIINMIDDELLELRASTPQGTYHSLLRTSKASKESSTELVKGFKKANSIVTATKQVQEDLKKGIITKQEAKDKGFNLYIEYMSKSGERFLTENAEKYGYIYTKGVI